MSAIESCLKTNEMSTSNTKYVDSFETIDEDKDSDEESFHLFLEDDDDEVNKSSDKTISTEVYDDANKNCDEEKEKVNDPNNKKLSNSTQMDIYSSEDESSNVISSRELLESQNPETPNLLNEESATEIHTQNESSEPEMPEKPEQETCAYSNTEKNVAAKEEGKTASSISPIQTDNSVLTSNVASESCELENETNKNEQNSKDITVLNENDDENTLNVESNSKCSTLLESEDDILNKHVIDNPEEPSEDLDPFLEDSLLKENDDIPEKSCTENIFSSSETEPPVTQEEIIPATTEAEVNSTPVQESEGVVNDNSLVTVKDNSVDVEVDLASDENRMESNAISQKCDDNSNSSDPDDLLDISMIKDCAQDDADIAEDALQLEQEIEDSERSNTGNSKTIDRIESIDDSSNLENSDEDVKGGYCSESQEVSENLNEFSDSEKDKDQLEGKKESSSTLADGMQCEDEKKAENGLTSNNILSPIFQDDNSASAEKPAMKRAFSDETLESEAKKPKLVKEAFINENNCNSWDITELQSLISFSQFMTKSHLKKLTRADLEEFCIQKLCEAILHKSELGETNHQLKIQEQTIEALRKEQSVLAKQVKDLEIVNKKLMHEVRNHLGSKPIVPVKITRSVGLQVRMAQPNDSNTLKRRPSQSTPLKQQTPVQSPVVNNRIGATKIVQNNAVTRQVMPKSPPKQTTPILTQALQNRCKTVVNKSVKSSPQNNTPTRPAIKSKPTPEKKPRTAGSYIDLTDEDDKKTNNAANQNSVKTIVPQGVRINTVPKTSISSALPTVVSSTAQVMYVVQSNPQLKQGVLTTATGHQKAVLVNFQPTNGVINSLNTSSVSVIPKVTASVPLKTTPKLVKTYNHPAPLPNPPVIQGLNDKSLKGIPPKPVLSIRKTNTGIILQWRMPYDLGLYEGIASYQLYAYQETNAPPSTDMWRKVGDVKAMALPMACTLTQFADKNKYYFAVRPVDIHKRIGRFSNPEEISL